MIAVDGLLRGQSLRGKIPGEPSNGEVPPISPHSDVRGYLQQTVLPSVNSAIEALLHHVHESGELQAALRERAEREAIMLREEKAEAKRRDSHSHINGTPAAEHSHSEKSPHGHSHADELHGKEGKEGKESKEHREGKEGKDGRDKDRNTEKDKDKEKDKDREREAKDGRGDKPADTEADAESAPAEPEGFDPLIWLAEQLRQSARGPTDQYRDKIEQRVNEYIQTLEESQPEECEEDKEETGSVNVEAAPPGSEKDDAHRRKDEDRKRGSSAVSRDDAANR